MQSEAVRQTEAGREVLTPTVYHIPVCPFSQRLEILLALKGLDDHVEFHVVDITRPRPEWLLEKTRGGARRHCRYWRRRMAGSSREHGDPTVLKDRFPEPTVAQRDPYRHAVEGMMNAMEGDFCAWGYRYMMNQDADRREDFRSGRVTARPYRRPLPP